jgi:nicotinate-nucleotide adenylyltransferase
MKVGLFLGSFNPPHIGHVNIVREVLNSKLVDNVWVIPAYQNPNKNVDTSENFSHRYNMCKLMFEELPNTYVNLIECVVKPKYTYDLLTQLKKEYPEADFRWIITDETLIEIIYGQWYNSDELLEENKFIVVEGTGKYNEEYPDEYYEIVKSDRNKCIYLQNPINMSSTQIRKMIEDDIIPVPFVNKETYKQCINLYKINNDDQ